MDETAAGHNWRSLLLVANGGAATAPSGNEAGSTIVHGGTLARIGCKYVPAEGFASVVTVSAPATARVRNWVALNATRRIGPWNPVRSGRSGQARTLRKGRRSMGPGSSGAAARVVYL